jgi:hypothetical protein
VASQCAPRDLTSLVHHVTLTWDAPECRARVGRPAGFRSPHTSDDELEPAVTFFAKFNFFLEDSKDFSWRVARAYYACELNEHAIDSLHADFDVLSYLQRLSRNCFADPEAPHEPWTHSTPQTATPGVRIAGGDPTGQRSDAERPDGRTA